MTPEITDLIKKKAEEVYPLLTTKIPEERWGYISGQTEGIELMIGFENWKHQNYIPVEDENYAGLYVNRFVRAAFYTNLDLLAIYIKEVLSK